MKKIPLCVELMENGEALVSASNLGSLIRTMRMVRGLTATRLALSFTSRPVESARVTLSNWECGVASPRIENLMLLLELMGYELVLRRKSEVSDATR